MDDKKNSPDLEEDEELASLRLAALATLKNRSTKNEEPNPAPINNILAINSITRATDYSSDHGSYKNQQSWRTNNQTTRKRGRVFTKPPNQRSNLIVVTPVGVENPDAQEDRGRRVTEKTAPRLLLPQHKWLKQLNDDSLSPKTDRHTGPTRFNRHGSESESSESDYDDSDNSYSNETILQDEPSRFSRTDENESEVEQKNYTSSEPPLSFQNMESDSKDPNYDYKNSETTISNCEKTIYSTGETNNLSQTIPEPLYSKHSYENGGANRDKYNLSGDEKLSCSFNISSASENGKSDAIPYSKPLVDSNKAAVPKSKHTPIKFDVSDNASLKESSKQSLSSNDKSSESYVSKDSRHIESEHSSSKNKITSLSKNDLRFELKRKKEISGKPSVPSKQVKVSNIRRVSHSRKRSRARSWSRERSGSRERRNCRKSRSRTPRSKRSRDSSRSWSTSSSSSSSLSSSDSSPVVNRSISSVVQPVQSKIVVSDTINNIKSSISRKPLQFKEIEPLNMKTKSIAINLKPISNMKISVAGNEQQNSATDIKKRGPVHMRLGAFPRNRVIQMPKSVEAAFLNSSSDDDSDVNIKCKKTNFVLNDKFEKDTGFQRHSTKVLPSRSDVPKIEKGRVLR